jgi:hypothetical protein
MQSLEQMLHEKKWGWRFYGSSNTGFFRLKCAKTRLQASIISHFFQGVTPQTPVNKREVWEGKDEACELGKEKRETRDTGNKERSSDVLTGGGVCSIASGG